MWVSGRFTACANPDCADPFQAPRVTHEHWDARFQVVVGRAICDACGTDHAFTRKRDAGEVVAPPSDIEPAP